MRRAGTLFVAGVLLLAACSGPTPQPTPQPAPDVTSSPGRPSAEASPATATPSPTAPATPAPEPSSAPHGDPLAGWTLEEKVGQLLMVGVGVTDPEPVSRTAVEELHVGNVFLHGRSEAGVDATRRLTDDYRALVAGTSPHRTPPLVATDQEGGLVQVLRGPGFSEIPPATEQATWSPETLEGRAETWGRELAAAGVNLNLAPVMDLVPEESAEQNPPIGYFSRSYGYTAGSVTTSAGAFSAGQRAAGVETVIKHFPGLGRVTQNTDTTAGVSDTVTTADSPSVEVFRTGIEDGARFVMVSTAVYDRIDPRAPAAFSPVVVEDLLRGNLRFEGVVMTDDVSAAAQVEQWPPGERAVRAVDAGVDLVLASADPGVVPEMADALAARARQDAAFAAKVDQAARRVLTAKSRLER